MSIHDAMIDACRAVGIVPPQRTQRGHWTQTPAEGKARSNTSGRVMINADGASGVAYNWITGQRQRFTEAGAGHNVNAAPWRPDPDMRRAEAERHRRVAEVCRAIVAACRTERHAYLIRKGFPDELALVIDDARPYLPSDDLGEAMARAMMRLEGPLLVVPGRVGRDLVTVQFIAVDGEKRNILGGAMSGAAHRIATGRETWVCEGIATALSVRAALRLLGRSATVLSAFAANNVAKVAASIPGSIIAADHDKPLEQLNGLGTGEHYARSAGRVWTMPASLGDFNDWHQAEGLRAVAMHLRGVGMG